MDEHNVPTIWQKVLHKIELDVEASDLSARWINADIRPIESERRTWNFWAFHNFWVIGGFNVSSFLSGSALLALGLTWWQALISIIVGNICSSALIAANSMMGSRYHVGFPVSNRSVWGMYGSFFPVLNRILLSIVWFGFQAWIGGECVYMMLMALDPNIEDHIPNKMAASTGVTSAQFLAYWLFMIVTIPLVWIRPHKLTPLLLFSAVISTTFMVILLIWALATMGPKGLGSITSLPSSVPGGNIGWIMAYGIISSIGSISSGILNVGDYARFAGRPRDAVAGQALGVVLYGTLGPMIGILVTAATEHRFGQPLWNLPTLFEALIQSGGAGARAASFFAGLALAISQIGLNVPGNAMSGGFDMASVFPRYINIRRGAYLTLLLSVATNPWRLVTKATTFIAVLGGYSVFTSPMIGLMIAAFWIVNRQKICVNSLYMPREGTTYWFSKGVNIRAAAAWIVGVLPFMPGFVSSVNSDITVSAPWTHLYYCSFLLGFCISVVVYAGLHYVWPDKQQHDFIASSGTANDLVRLYEEQWVVTIMDAESRSVVEDVDDVIKHDRR